MADNLTTINGEVSAAFNVSRGHPWHRLGEQVEEDMTIGRALKLIGVYDEIVEPRTLYTLAENVYGEPEYEEVESRIAIWSNVFKTISTASPGYEITQRRDMLELAYEIVGLDKHNAHIDTVGNIGEKGEVFFSYIRVPDLVLDPNGIADTIERGLFVGTSFDGSLQNTIGYSNIRVVCQNTLNMALGKLQQAIKVRHTKNSADRMMQAAAGLKYVGAVEKEMVIKAEQMLGVNGDRAMNAIIRYAWDLDKEDVSDRTKERRQAEIGALWELYDGPGNTNTRLAGPNGYAAYNAFTEYVDHHRSVRGRDGKARRTRDAVLPSKWTKMKVDVSRIVGELVDA